MPVKVKITPFEKSFKLIVDRNLSPEARSKRVAAFARKEIAAADAQNARALGTAPPKTVTVDGRQGVPLEKVSADRGIIIAEWQLVGDVLQWIFATLRARSPRVSGEYLRGHTLYADGVECSPQRPPPAAEYAFLNLVPHSRKIEIGKTKSGRDFVIQVENRIYERTANDAKAKFGNVARVRFTYQAAIGGRVARRNQTDRVPAIVVTLK